MEERYRWIFYQSLLLSPFFQNADMNSDKRWKRGRAPCDSERNKLREVVKSAGETSRNQIGCAEREK